MVTRKMRRRRRTTEWLVVQCCRFHARTLILSLSLSLLAIILQVGVQSKVSKKNESAPLPKPDAGVGPPARLPVEEEENLTEKLYKMRQERELRSQEADVVDWSELAEMLEADEADPLLGTSISFMDDFGLGQESSSLMEESSGSLSQPDDVPIQDEKLEKVYFDYFRQSPRDLVTMTIRSELVESLTGSNGDTSDPRFVSALELLSKLYDGSSSPDMARSDILNGHWKSISRPSYHYGGFVGTNDAGDNVYSLGKMCFNMFKPGNLRVTVQNTMNCIEPVCRMDQAPSAAPWSLRQELALQDDSDWHPNTTLKSYDIAVALTIEPGQFMAKPGEVVPSPARRLRATHVVKGFFLPDPDTPNRMTVWFTGGSLSPVLPPDSSGAEDPSRGTLNDWIDLFGAEHKRTWSEAFGVLGAKLLLGADLPDGMEPDGTMSYTLSRPYGGHGKGYADILYADRELLVTKGNTRTIHVMINSAEDSK